MNAFDTARALSNYLELAPGEKALAGHSIGNVLAGAAMTDWNARPASYFMINADHDTGRTAEVLSDTDDNLIALYCNRGLVPTESRLELAVSKFREQGVEITRMGNETANLGNKTSKADYGDQWTEDIPYFESHLVDWSILLINPNRKDGALRLVFDRNGSQGAGLGRFYEHRILRPGEPPLKPPPLWDHP